MKFNIGDHLQEIDSVDGYVVESFTSTKSGTDWYLLENDELKLINHWVPESKLELHKQPLSASFTVCVETLSLVSTETLASALTCLCFLFVILFLCI